MDKSINVTINDLGIIDGFQTWEVIDVDSGNVVGYNQQVVEE